MQLKSMTKKLLLYMFLFVFFLSESRYIHMAYAADLQFYNYTTNKYENYTGKQVIYILNGRELPLSYPGILINGTALADYEELFVRELGLQAEKNGDVLTLSDGKTELKLIFGSKNVLINSETAVMSVAPVKLQFDDIVKYYVPTRYVAETFGFEYVWNSSSSTVKITKTLPLKADNVPFTYNSTLFCIKYNNQEIPVNMPVIYYKGTVFAPAKQIFETAGCNYNENNTNITITKNELTLSIELHSKIAYVNNKKIIMDSMPVQITECSTGNTERYVSLEFVSDMLGFELRYSDSTKCYELVETASTGQISLYPDLLNGYWEHNIQDNNNVTEEYQIKEIYYDWYMDESASENEHDKRLSRVLAYATEEADIVELYGICREDIQDFFDDGLVVFELNNVYSELGTQYFSDFSASHLTYTLLTSLSENNTKLFFMIPLEDEWTFVEKTDCVQVIFSPADLSSDDLIISSTGYPDDKLIIPLQGNVLMSHITEEDNYLNRNFQIKILGNYVDFFEKNPIINPYYCIKNMDISYDETTYQTIISITTKSICGYKYTIENGYLSVTIGKPDEIYSKILVLDAGHGGIDPGASKKGFKEKDINFKIINTYTKELFEKSDIKVYFTRETDTKIDLYERAAFASEVGADMFISLHMNSNNSSSVNGTEVYYCKDNNVTSETGFNSYQMAKALVNNLSLALNTKNRGALKAEFVVVKYNTVPAVLIELGYMTNTSDLTKLTNTTYQKKAAETIYHTVIGLFNDYLLR